MNLDHIAANIQTLRLSIKRYEMQYGRSPGSVSLLAVSKQQPVAAIECAIANGLSSFGENYLQEALPKIQALHHHPIEWHFIGKIQSNKTAIIAEHFAWVQSLDRLSIAQRLNDNRPKDSPPLNCLIQVNSEGELQKGGVAPDDLKQFAETIMALPRLRLRGLMAIPAVETDASKQRITFNVIANLFKQLQTAGFPIDVLSLGMSQDYEAAIAEQSTMVRLGTAIFGERA